MIDWLESIDRSIVLTVNSWHTPFLDEFFWFISARWPWIPLYLFLLFLCWKQFGTRKTLVFVGIVIATIALVDLTSVYFFKEAFQRYRPSHHAWLTNRLHFYLLKESEFRDGKFYPSEYYKGGSYGFISSHATNFFAISTLIGFSLKQYYPKLLWILFAISILVCFSRLYLGVHYLSDLIGGALWGGSLAYVSYRLFVKRFVLSE